MVDEDVSKEKTDQHYLSSREQPPRSRTQELAGQQQFVSLEDNSLTQSNTTTLTNTSVVTNGIVKPKHGNLIFAKDIATMLSLPRVEVLLVALVLLSSISAAYGTLPDLDPATAKIVREMDELISYMFATEFTLRFWSNWGRQPLWEYLSQPLVVVDLIVVVLPLALSLLQGDAATLASSILPTWLMSRTGLVNLRLLRILRVQRILKNLDTFSQFEMALGLSKSDVRPYQLQLARVVISVFTLLSVSTGLIYTTEHVVNPDIPDYFTALYFGLTTLTTVGFGDITPVTAQGKLVVSGSILAGVAIIPAQAASLVEALLDYQRERELSSGSSQVRTSTLSPSEQKKLPKDGMLDTRTVCNTCGAAFHWSDAEFCWSCGSKLLPTNEQIIDGDSATS